MATTDKPTTAGPAEETAGPMPASFAAAIDAEYGYMVRADHPSVVAHAGVPAFAPGDRIPASHPALAGLLADGVAVPYTSPGD
jgi:hypothetical protein